MESEPAERFAATQSLERLVTLPGCGYDARSQDTLGFLELINPNAIAVLKREAERA